jgi:outer membrane protein assembly factor BamA
MTGEPGLGESKLVWNIHLKKGFEAGPGDFDFFAAQTAATASAYWGNITSRDFLIRLTLGGAIVTGNSPRFEEFRLGGESTVRGLEYGERIARGAVYETVQAGITVDRLVSAISQVIKKQKEERAAAKESGQGAGGLDLKSIFLNAFFDYAYITGRGSRDPDGTRSLEAVGLSLEMRLPESAGKGSLELGYAWSPDSIHEHGRIFTSAHFDLF